MKKIFPYVGKLNPLREYEQAKKRARKRKKITKPSFVDKNCS